MKVALYARVSKDEASDDARYQNPENQLVALRNYCKSQGWEITKEFVDFASGADPNRTEFRKIMNSPGQLPLSNLKSTELVRSTRGYDALIVWKLDRFSREPLLQTMYYIERLKSANVALISLTETWLDTRKENPMTDLVLAVMSWMASEERRKISERTKAGIARRRAIGQWKGGRPKKKREGTSTAEENTALAKTSVLGEEAK